MAKASTFQSVKQLATQVHRLLEKGDVAQESAFHMKEIMLSLRQLSMKYLKTVILDNLRESTSKIIDSHFVASYRNLAVQVDTDTKREYVDIPVQYVSLDDDAGIQRITPNSKMATEKRAMIPVTRAYMDLLGASIGTFLENQWSYEVHRDKAYFNKRKLKTLKDLKINTVDMDVVVISPKDVGDDDPFPLPPEFQHDLIIEVLQLYGVSDQRAKDLLNNENPDD